MDVRALLKEKGDSVHTVRPEETIETLIKALKRHNIGAAVVCARYGEVLGVVSERDVVRAIAARGASALKQEVHELMTYRTISCRPDDDVKSVMEKMDHHNIRHMPVIDTMGLVGMLSIRDVNRARVALIEMEAAVLKDVATAARTANAMR